jgi:hypothetical protein
VANQPSEKLPRGLTGTKHKFSPLFFFIHLYTQSALLGCDMWIGPMLIEFLSSLRALTWVKNSG